MRTLAADSPALRGTFRAPGTYTTFNAARRHADENVAVVKGPVSLTKCILLASKLWARFDFSRHLPTPATVEQAMDLLHDSSALEQWGSPSSSPLPRAVLHTEAQGTL